MVHPTPILIPPLLTALPRLPPIGYCHVTKKFRALSATEESKLWVGTMKANIVRLGEDDDQSKYTSKPHAGHSLSANSYPLPPSIVNSQSNSQSQNQGGQRQKQLNNTTPVPPPAPAGTDATTIKEKVPPPTIFWNDHLRML